MSKEKIEKMIEALKKCSCVYTECEQECSQCSNEELYDETLNHIARTLYEAGYRKQIVGEWISNRQTDEFICSLCGEIAPVDCLKEAFYKSKFCPNCGAHMKGGAE